MGSIRYWFINSKKDKVPYILRRNNDKLQPIEIGKYFTRIKMDENHETLLFLRDQIKETQQQKSSEVAALQQQVQALTQELGETQAQLQLQQQLAQVQQNGTAMLESIRANVTHHADSLIDERTALARLEDIFGQTQTAIRTLENRALLITEHADQSAATA